MPTDFHIHLLPGIDDGAQSFEETLAMARCSEADGVKDIICTPHMNADLGDLRFLGRNEALLADVQRRLAGEGVGVTLRLGAEWMLSADLPDIVREHGRLGGTRAFLFELSPFMTAAAAEGLVRDTTRAGLRPVLAHPERYPWMNPKNAAQLGRLAGMGCSLQLTAGSLAGAFGRGVQKTARAIALLFPELILLASDAHNTGLRKPGLTEGFAGLDRIIPGLARQAQQRAEQILTTEK